MIERPTSNAVTGQNTWVRSAGTAKVDNKGGFGFVGRYGTVQVLDTSRPDELYPDETRVPDRLVKEIAQSGPRLRLEVTALDMARSWEQLRAGIMDAAIIGPWDIPSDMLGEPLFDEHLRCLVRADHPILDPAVPVTAARYCAFPQAVFRITGEGGHPIDAALAAQGLSRRVVARLPFFQSAGEVAATTDVIVNLPASLAHTLTARDPGLVSFLPPLPAPICYRVSLVWPRALDQAAPQRWLRSRLCASAAALVDAVGAASGQLQRVVPH